MFPNFFVLCFGKCFGPSTRAPKFLTQISQLYIIKIPFKIKVNSICGAGWDTRNLCHKLNSQGPVLRILGLRVASPKPQGSNARVLGVRVPSPRVLVPGFRVPRYHSPRVPGPRVPSPRSQGPGSLVSGYEVSGSQFLGFRS